MSQCRLGVHYITELLPQIPSPLIYSSMHQTHLCLHEFLAVPVSEIDPSELSNMVQDINYEHVNEEDRLSNQVFSYDRNAHELNVAVANPIKGIKNDDFTMSKVAESIPFANYDSKPAFAL